jgi:hypothetical protein
MVICFMPADGAVSRLRARDNPFLPCLHRSTPCLQAYTCLTAPSSAAATEVAKSSREQSAGVVGRQFTL